MRALILEHPRPPSPERFNDIANAPLSSCLMAGYVHACLARAGVVAHILDARHADFAHSERLILEARPQLLLVHAVYFWERTQEFFQSLARLKESGLESPVCLFGFFPSLCWSDLLAAYPQVDWVAVGEPEETLVELAQDLRQGREPRAPGLARRLGGKPVLPSPRPPIRDLDALPHPARPELAREETVNVQASRGCYNGCDFCLVPALGGGRSLWRGRSVANVVGEIEQLRRAGKRDFYFVDPNFIGPGPKGVARAMAMAEALSSLEITFGMECRAADVQPALVRALARAGLTSLLLGLESGSQDALDRMGKNISLPQSLAAMATVRQAGLEPEVGFIMFEPRSTLEDLEANLTFLRQARLLGRLGRTANLLHHHQIALKGTRLYAQAQAQGRLTPQGALGFEGRIPYDDPRVAWLAEAMRRLCLKVLWAMGDPLSGIHWSRDGGREPYATINGLLVEQFQRLLALGRSWAGEPPPRQAASALQASREQIEQALASARVMAG